MTDIPTPTPAPKGAAPDAPERPPLRAVFLVWPGRVHSQNWLFLWFGVMYLVASLLPWKGPMDAEYLLADGSRMTAASWHLKVENRVYDPARPMPAAVVEVDEPGFNLGRVLILLCSLGMIVTGLSNIWNRKLTLWPTLLTWLEAFVILYFSFGWIVNGQVEALTSVNGLRQLGDTAGAIFGNFGEIFGGTISAEVNAVPDRFGIGFYLCLLTEILVIVFILGSIVMGVVTSKGEDKGKAPPSKRPAAPPKK